MWTDRAVEFIRANRARPFFLFLAYNGPYGLGSAMLEPIRNRHRETYDRQTLPSFPRLPAHPWNHHYGGRIGELQSIRKYAAEISGIDLRSLGVKPQDWALAALAALAKTDRIISMDMLRAALTARFRDEVLASALQLVEKVYKNQGPRRDPKI